MLFQTLFTNPILFLSFLIALIVAISFHEAAHAFSALKLGDDTAQKFGRTTLNPLAHLDLIGTLFLLFFGFGWGKPVPINPHNFKHPHRDEFLSSLAGPLTNFALAIIFGLTLRFAGNIISDNLQVLFSLLTFINLILMIFNLLPIPPLDGSKILRLFISEEMYWRFSQNGLWILIALLFLTYFGLPIFETIIYTPSNFLFGLITNGQIGF
ncbi:MAG: peptidase M50 [Candidatus Berkelbacteria bacterium Licking1014_7]|uniref:Peptidase M50 n=1 Tax=Candidatus Berkelbacteria bacterium Licking1014_7 TaxID=2017147 RepID=A0A554LK20_9BACT|nr:MAG: peptidase M50 [Candidatus Berkelbacteria bacterium Licking1014_7]